MSASRAALALALLVFPAFAACGDGAKKRPIGATCEVSSQCVSGICGGGHCLDPAADDDGDNLVNRVEAALSTDPVLADTDGDRVNDDVEVGDISAPTDTDGDGKIDAIESSIADADGDCIPDQFDAQDDFSNAPSEGFPNACGNDQPVLVCASVSPTTAKSCAAPLFAALRCFDPVGCYSYGFDDNTTVASWDNGAKLFDNDKGDLTYVSSRGATCFSIANDSSEESMYVRYYVGAATYDLTQTGDTGGIGIRCPSGTRVSLQPNDTAALVACTGGNRDVWQPCETPQPE